MKRLVRKTKRLLIRPFELKDYETWKKAFIAHPKPKNKFDEIHVQSETLTLVQFKKKLKLHKERRTQGKHYHLGIFSRNSQELIGTIGLGNIFRGVMQNANLGYALFHSRWGQGYGREAVQAVIDLGLRDLKLHRISASVEPQNRRSIALVKSVGLRKEGVEKRSLFLRGRWVDLTIYAATCEEFGIK